MTLPADREVAGGSRSHRAVNLVGGGGVVGPGLPPRGRPGRVVAVAVAPLAGFVLARAPPGDHETAGGPHRHGGELLVARGGGVDLELAPLGNPGRVVALAVD